MLKQRNNIINIKTARSMQSPKTGLILSLALVSLLSSHCTAPVAPPTQAREMQQAITSGNLAQVEHLMAQNQINVNHPLEIDVGLRKASFMPLHLAVMCRQPTLVTYFLAKGAAIEAKTAGNEQTALHLAAAMGQEEIVQILLTQGADIHAQTKQGETALDLASKQGHRAMIEFLIAHGAVIPEQEKEPGLSANPSLNSGQAEEDKGPSANLGQKGTESSPQLGQAGEDKGPSANLGQIGTEPSPQLGQEGEGKGPSANLGQQGSLSYSTQ